MSNWNKNDDDFALKEKMEMERKNELEKIDKEIEEEESNMERSFRYHRETTGETDGKREGHHEGHDETKGDDNESVVSDYEDMTGDTMTINTDMLYLDQEVPASQEFSLISFATPSQTNIEKKESYFMKHFVRDEFMFKLLRLVREKLIERKDELLTNFEETLNDTIVQIGVSDLHKHVDTDYKYYKSGKRVELEEKLRKKCPDLLFDHMIKVRGSGSRDGTYLTEREKYLTEHDPDKFIIYRVQTGGWVPFEPDITMIQDVETRETVMNNIITGYRKNEEDMNKYFKADVRERLRKKMDIQEKKFKIENKERIEKARLYEKLGIRPKSIVDSEGKPDIARVNGDLIIADPTKVTADLVGANSKHLVSAEEGDEIRNKNEHDLFVKRLAECTDPEMKGKMEKYGKEVGLI